MDEFNAQARQFLNRFRHLIIREDFGGVSDPGSPGREYNLLHLEDELKDSGLMLYMDAPYFNGVDIAFRIGHQSLNYEVFADAAINDRKTLVEAEIPFSLFPEKLIGQYEKSKSAELKDQILDVFTKCVKDEGFTFIDNSLGRHALGQIFDLWYREEIENRPQNLRTWQLPSPGIK